MNKIFGMVLAVVATIGLTSAHAGDFYVTGQGSYTNWSEDADSTYGAGVGVGMNMNDWLAVEATFDNLGSTTGGDQARSGVAWVVVDPTVATIAGMPLKATARVGYARTRVITDTSNFTDTDPAYGIGVALGVSENTDVFVDVRRRTLDTKYGTGEFKTANVGIKYSF